MREAGGDALAQAALRVGAELLGLQPTLSLAPLRRRPAAHAGRAGIIVDAGPGSSPGRGGGGAAAGPGRLLCGTTAARPGGGRGRARGTGAAAPFASHNGLVARAPERLVLVARGVDAEVARRPRGGAPGAAPRVRVEPPGVREGGPSGCTPGCCTPPRPTRGAPRRARSRPARTCGRRLGVETEAPPLTRETRLPGVHRL